MHSCNRSTRKENVIGSARTSDVGPRTRIAIAPSRVHRRAAAAPKSGLRLRRTMQLEESVRYDRTNLKSDRDMATLQSDAFASGSPLLAVIVRPTDSPNTRTLLARVRANVSNDPPLVLALGCKHLIELQRFSCERRAVADPRAGIAAAAGKRDRGAVHVSRSRSKSRAVGPAQSNIPDGFLLRARGKWRPSQAATGRA